MLLCFVMFPLKRAHDSLKTSLTRLGNTHHRAPLLEQMKRDREMAEKDNNFIYHESIPKPGELSRVPAEGAISIPPFKTPILGDQVKDLFTELVSIEVMEARNQANAIRKALLSAEHQRLKDASIELNG